MWCTPACHTPTHTAPSAITLSLDFVAFIYDKFSLDVNFILKTDGRSLTVLHGVWANDRVTSSDVISCHGNMETIAANIEAKFQFSDCLVIKLKVRIVSQ